MPPKNIKCLCIYFMTCCIHFNNTFEKNICLFVCKFFIVQLPISFINLKTCFQKQKIAGYFYTECKRLTLNFHKNVRDFGDVTYLFLCIPHYITKSLIFRIKCKCCILLWWCSSSHWKKNNAGSVIWSGIMFLHLEWMIVTL